MIMTAALAHHHPSLDDDEFIELINTAQTSWEAGRNFAEKTPIERIKRLLLQAMPDPFISRLIVRSEDNDPITITPPDRFDAREAWRKCQTIGEVRHQGACASSWAIAPTSAMSDRLCIFGHSLLFHVSPQDLLTCCTECGWGCAGGFTSAAWLYWEKRGIHSGLNVNMTKLMERGCMPYTVPKCSQDNPDACPEMYKLPPCTERCIVSLDNHTIMERGDLNKTERLLLSRSEGSEIRKVEGEKQIKATILNQGPVSATFMVYEDFLFYKNGVYVQYDGEYLGQQAVRLLGWGVENDLPYWLAANSWGSEWGDSGFFKILRRNNHCSIESEVVTGRPYQFTRRMSKYPWPSLANVSIRVYPRLLNPAAISVQ